MKNSSLPPHKLVTCIPEKREPGMMVFNVRPGGASEHIHKDAWILGIDQAGAFALNLHFAEQTQDVRLLPNKNLLFSFTAAGQIRETKQNGELVRQWHISGKWQDKKAPEDSIPIDLPLTHHTINHFPNGNLLLLSVEQREYPDWPSSDEDPNADTEIARVMGDVIVEVAPDGGIVNQWKLLDILDPYRICYGSRAKYWVARGFPDSMDWCHSNAVVYDPSDDTLMISLRTQDCIIKIHKESGELKWILGDPSNWRAPWSDKLLRPVGDLDWQYHQHDCSVTQAGTVLCFDNGNFRALPFAEKTPAEKSYSRALEFEVDDAAMTVRQVWSHDGVSENRDSYACYQGGAYRLPKTGNTFITYGGVCTDEGVPTNNNMESFVRARLVEVTPNNEIVFDLWITAENEPEQALLSSFRAEHIPAL